MLEATYISNSRLLQTGNLFYPYYQHNVGILHDTIPPSKVWFSWIFNGLGKQPQYIAKWKKKFSNHYVQYKRWTQFLKYT